MKVCMVGEGAFAKKHLQGLGNIEGVEVAVIVGGVAETTAAVAAEYGIPEWTTELGEALIRPDITAAILTTPTPLHASQAIQVMRAGKHVEIEIPIADKLSDALEVDAVQKDTGLVAMAGHTRRFNPSHQWIHQRIQVGELRLQHLIVETLFFRRQNLNAEGHPRSWTDHLLWHHACHSVDLFQYQAGEAADTVRALQGPPHPELGIAMDMSIGMRTTSGVLCTISLSFNNEGPFGTSFRYIFEEGTYIARYDDLFDGDDNPIDLSGVAVCTNGIELQDREFIDSIREGREPLASVARILPAMQTLGRIEQALRDSD